jgi:hypothetical protein
MNSINIKLKHLIERRMIMKKIAMVLFTVFLVFGMAGVSSANLLQNGDFETLDDSQGLANNIALNNLANGQWDVYESIPGWSSTYPDTGGIEVQRNTIVSAHSPDHYVELDSESPNSNSFMYQAFDVVEEIEYILSFWYQPRTSTPGDNGIQVLLGTPYNDILFADGVRTDTTDWEFFSYNLGTLSEGQYFLGFQATGSENELGGFLDDISIDPVPEPATLILLGMGLLGLVGVRRKFMK